MLEQAFENFKEEAELFFVSKLVTTPTLEKEYKNGLDILFNITKTVDSNRGLLVYNPRYGQGKSFFFEVAQHRHKRRKGKNAFRWTNARELCEIFTNTKNGQDPEKALNDFINVKNLFIDDIGDELSDGKERSNYANKLNVIRHVLLRRYDMWVKKGWKLHGTTNLTETQISENYDGRVLDRLQQMTHIRKFEFLTKGSFRQMPSTRKLNQEEIQKSWDKFKTPEVKFDVDMNKYFNELINEPDAYFQGRELSFWNFTRKYFEENGLIKDSDYEKIDEALRDSAKSNLKKDIRETKRVEYKNATNPVRAANIESAINNIRKQDVTDAAKNAIVRRKFFELKESNHIFK